MVKYGVKLKINYILQSVCMLQGNAYFSVYHNFSLIICRYLHLLTTQMAKFYNDTESIFSAPKCTFKPDPVGLKDGQGRSGGLVYGGEFLAYVSAPILFWVQPRSGRCSPP